MTETLPGHATESSVESSSATEAGAGGSVAALLMRTADCLTALLRSPTATAGLNESRYNVLDALRRMPAGMSTQSELATRLLQSESNLSTLLDRMQHDGLISRVRSESDRRKFLIRLAAAGSDALIQADHERHRAAARILRSLDENRTLDLCEALAQLLKRFELELGVSTGGRAGSSAADDHRSQASGAVPPPHLHLVNSSRTSDSSLSPRGHTS
jgi:DNA-binding MarR family transcriptional regulator